MASEFAAPVQKRGPITRLLGFSDNRKTYLNLTLTAAFTFFCVWRIKYLFRDLLFENVARQEWQHWGFGIIGQMFHYHLFFSIPAGILAMFQFIPTIRQKALWFHRWNGWVSTVFLVPGVLLAIGIAHRSFGAYEDYSLQACYYIYGTSVLYTTYRGIKAARAHKIEEHRRWMLRCWSILGVNVSLRVIHFTGIIIVGMRQSYFSTFSCDEVSFILSNATELAKSFPQCTGPLMNGTAAPGFDPTGIYVPIRTSITTPELVASWNKDPYNPASWLNIVAHAAQMLSSAQIGAESAIRNPFNMALWVALILQVVACEIYLEWSANLKSKSRSEKIKAQ